MTKRQKFGICRVGLVAQLLKQSNMASSMEVQSSSKDVSETVLASSGSSGSVSVALHPLVIMNISEHYTRIKAQYGNANPQGNFFYVLKHLVNGKDNYLTDEECFLILTFVWDTFKNENIA